MVALRRGCALFRSCPPRLSPSQSTFHLRRASTQVDVVDLLSKPSWSVKSLLPSQTDQRDAPAISSQQLHHLLRLSALPSPKSQEEEQKMVETLASQLHFVKEMQQVDTSGVLPLPAIRDETLGAEEESTITLETLKDTLAQEEIVGKHFKRIRRKNNTTPTTDVENWNVTGHAERTAGRYFIVHSEKY